MGILKDIIIIGKEGYPEQSFQDQVKIFLTNQTFKDHESKLQTFGAGRRYTLADTTVPSTCVKFITNSEKNINTLINETSQCDTMLTITIMIHDLDTGSLNVNKFKFCLM